MTVERDIVRFALPFAAGVLTACTIPAAKCLPMLAAAMPAGIAAATGTYIFSVRGRKKPAVMAGIIGAAFLTGIFCLCNARIMELSEVRSHGYITALAVSCCRRLQECIDSVPFADADTSALIKALLTGDRSGIPRGISDAFRSSGASHILALSGMHLGIIYGIAGGIFSIFGNSSKGVRIRSLCIMLTCGFYTLATGAGESITRAFLFILLGETARIFHRHMSIRQTLMASLVIQLACSPLSISDVGFQLSYAAMAGIAFIHPSLRGFWPDDGNGRSIPEKIWDTVSMSISCQLATAPLAWHYFHTFPTHFILTNLLAIPMTSLIIPTSLLCIMLQLAGICPDFLIQATEMLVSGLTASLRIIAVM